MIGAFNSRCGGTSVFQLEATDARDEPTNGDWICQRVCCGCRSQRRPGGGGAFRGDPRRDPAGGRGQRLSGEIPAGTQTAVDAAYTKYRNLKEGKNADYIPALAKVDPNLFGIAVVTADGKVCAAGDLKTEGWIE